jgi:histidinol-phosphate aminotransferase
MRVGYAIGPGGILRNIDKFRLPFNTAGPAQAAAIAALDDHEHVRRSIESNREGMRQLETGLDAIGIKHVPSFANFMLVELGMEAGPISDELLKLGVIVRPMRWMGFPQAVRVTVGTRAENEKFLAALAQVLTAVAVRR